MPSLKEYKEKLHSLGNIQKITRTMKLVATSKLRQAHHAQASAKLYAQELTKLIARLEASVDAELHPLLVSREEVKKILVLVFTSDKGLCGGFNNNLSKRVHKWIIANATKYGQIDLSFCGKRGFLFFKNYPNVKKNYEGVTARPDFAHAMHVGEDLQNAFLNEGYDEIYFAFNQFHNPISQTPAFEKIIPIESENLLDEKEQAISSDYIFEPTKIELLKFLIPKFLFFKIHYTLLENSAGEHGARMTAMDNATQNASELIDEYTLLRNRARQAAITKELIEITSGAEALKG